MSNIQLIATSTFGLESVVAEEVKKLGYDQVQVENGKITYSADYSGICRSNLWLRSADRIKWKIGEFKALSFEELFEKTKALPWADILPQNASFPVLGRSVKSKLFSISDCQAIVKKAIVEKMKQSYHIEWFAEDGPQYTVEVALLKDMATITIDTSGTGLHKRGYRSLHNEAPMKETMAAGLILLSRWKPDRPLMDPFCGSGTIPIEAALIGRNIAPGINRSFASQNWPNISQEAWGDAIEEALDLANYGQKLTIFGSDIDKQSVELSQHNAEEAEVQDAITFRHRDVRQLTTEEQYGYLVCNPPYGERLGEKRDIEQLYQTMGQVFPHHLKTWSIYVFTAEEQFETFYGAKATKKRKLYSGNIRCDYYQFFGPRPPRK